MKKTRFPILKRQTGGEIPVKFDHPLRLEEIPTKNKIHVINNYSPKYDYIVEGDKIYYALKGKNHWVDISDNNVARTNLYNFLGNNYDFRGYEDNEREIWDLVKNNSFDYQTYRESLNRPPLRLQVQTDSVPTQTTPLQAPRQEQMVTVRVGTSGGGFTNIQIPESWTTRQARSFFADIKPEYLTQAYDKAKAEQPYRYADPINNALNWAPFIILTGARGLANMGYDLVSPAINRGLTNVQNALRPVASRVTGFVRSIPTRLNSGVLTLTQAYRGATPAARTLFKSTLLSGATYEGARTAAPHLKGLAGDGDLGVVWDTAMDGNFGEALSLAWNGALRSIQKKFGGEGADVTSSLELPGLIDTNTEYAFRPQSFYGDTVRVNNRQYIIPESIDVNQFTFGYRNRGDFNPINSEAAPITAFNAFKPFGQHLTKDSKGRPYQTFIGIDRDGNLKVGDISQFKEGDYLTPTYSNEISKFKKDGSGALMYKRDGAHGNGSRSVPIVITADGREGSLSVLTDTNQRGNTYGNVSGGRVLVKVGDEFRVLSGSIEDIERMFEDMKRRNNAQSGTFYTLDNGSYNRGLRTYDRRFTTQDLQAYDRQNVGGGNFLYISGERPIIPQFSSDTIPTVNVRTIESDSYKSGHPLQNELRGVVLHHTGDYRGGLDEVVQDLVNPNDGRSAHVIIGEDGSRKVLATPDQVTFHAGYSVHNGRQNVNDFMVGIEFYGDTGKRDLTPQQIASAVEYLEPILRRNNIRLEDIVTHQQVRDLYNDYATRQGMSTQPNKFDINETNYNRIILALLQKVYYEK